MRVALLFVAALLVGAVLGGVSTASNAVPTGTLGQASAATSPYAISNVAYSLDVNSPRTISQVSFTISPANPRVVKAQLGGSWYSCTNVSGSVTCATSAPTASPGNLVVVATQ